MPRKLQVTSLLTGHTLWGQLFWGGFFKFFFRVLCVCCWKELLDWQLCYLCYCCAIGNSNGMVSWIFFLNLYPLGGAEVCEIETAFSILKLSFLEEDTRRWISIKDGFLFLSWVYRSHYVPSRWRVVPLNLPIRIPNRWSKISSKAKFLSQLIGSTR